MSRTQLGIWAVIAIVATRLVIGWHFYTEGRKKLSGDGWSAAGFLGQAQGPFAETFTSVTPQKSALLDSLLADPAAEEKLSEKKAGELAAWREKMNQRYKLDFSDFTIASTVDQWWHHRELLGDYYGFQGVPLEEDLKKSRAETRKLVVTLRDQRRQVAKHLEKYESLFPADGGGDDASKAGDETPSTGPTSDDIDTSDKEPLNDDVDSQSGTQASDGTASIGDDSDPAQPGDEDEPEAAGSLTDPEKEVLEAQRQDFERLTAEYNELDVKFREAERRYKLQEQQILLVRNQHQQSIDVIENWEAQLEEWLALNYETLREYREMRRRVAANAQNSSRQGVATLKGQSNKIEGDMKKLAAPLVAGLAVIWEGFNSQLNALATPEQAKETEFKTFAIARPDGESPRLRMINKFTPWFDVIVGALLILGLMTRIAALAGAGFLSMIVISQAPWLGNAPSEVFAYAAEMFALLVLAAVGAGRFAGLDFFLRCLFYSVFPPKSADMRRYETQRPVLAESVEVVVPTEERAEPITI